MPPVHPLAMLQTTLVPSTLTAQSDLSLSQTFLDDFFNRQVAQCTQRQKKCMQKAHDAYLLI